MTWTKLGDEFADECWTLSDAAFRLHTEGLCWSNRMVTDGQLAKDDMRRWAHHPEAAEELVAVGWWEDQGEHYQIIHHLGYQRTKEQIAHQSNVNRVNRAKGKTRPVKSESSDESSDKRDRTGQARTGEVLPAKKNEASDERHWTGLDRKGNRGTSPEKLDLFGESPPVGARCPDAVPTPSPSEAVENVKSVLGGRVVGEERKRR